MYRRARVLIACARGFTRVRSAPAPMPGGLVDVSNPKSMSRLFFLTFDDDGSSRLWRNHAEAGAGDLLDAVGLGGGGLLELEAPVLEIQVVALADQARQLDEHAAAFLARVDHTDRAGDDRGQQQQEHGDAEAAHHR